MTTMFSNSFNTSDELFAWLRSPEGGNLVVHDQDDPVYALIHYDKKKSDMAVAHVSACRSVIWNKVTNQLVMAGPCRSSKNTEAPATGFTAEEFVDGVMINMFYDTVRLEWRLATRTQMDASGNFYGKRTFGELFWETFTSSGLTREMLLPGTYYTWVLQHPDERIVVSPAYGIASIKLVQVSGPAGPEAERFFPAKYDHNTLADVTTFVTAEGVRQGAQFQGVVLKTADGKRFKLRTTQYTEARKLRGNQAKRPYTWLERWAEGRLTAYLRLYPEEQCDATAVVENFKVCTQELHDLYLKVYRKKELPLGKAPQKYRKLLWDAHKAGKGAYFPNLKQFMNDQDTARKLWLVNYAVRYGQPVETEEEEAVNNAVDVDPTFIPSAEAEEI
jgi:hypothetical protein